MKEFIKTLQDKSKWAELYRDWNINFLTVDYFAEYYGLEKELANFVIDYGRKCHNENAEKLKEATKRFEKLQDKIAKEKI